MPELATKQQIACEKIAQLSQKTERANWDNEGAPAIPAAEWKRAQELYQTTRSAGFPEPHISACGDGSVHIAWHQDEKEFLIERRGDEIYWSFEDGNNLYESGSTDARGKVLELLKSHIKTNVNS